MLTGGLHDRTLIAASIRSRACDLVGIARPAALVPDMPLRVILNRELDASKARVSPSVIPGAQLVRGLLGGKASHDGRVNLVGASVSTFWHEWQMARIGRGQQPDPELDWVRGVVTNTLWHDILGGGPRGWYKRWMGEW
jgi:hypothetical protein